MTQQTTRPQDRPSGAARGAQPADGRPVALIILGASGDLTSRLLLPGLATAFAAGQLPELTLVGSSITEMGNERWRELVAEALDGADVPDDIRAGIVGRAVWRTADATDADGLRALFDVARERAGEGAVSVLYFALAPAVTVRSVDALRSMADLPDGLRLALEKPFGTGLESARDLNAAVAEVAGKERVFRVDHFLGLAMVTALLGIRTLNRAIGGVWSAEDVEAVEIRADETLALEGRAGFYDATGAMLDMHQSHLLAVLAMTVLETPAEIRSVDLHDAVAAALRATHVWEDDVAAHTRRARYTAGAVRGRQVPSYADEDGVDPDRGTETLAELVLAVDTERWAGVPFTLRSGKALGEHRWEVVLTLRPPRFVPEGMDATAGRDRVRVGLDPARLALELSVDGTGEPFDADRAALDADLPPASRDAYGEVLRGIILGDPLLSVRGDVAEECWRIVEPVRRAWDAGLVPLEAYEAGSPGPEGWASSR
ncbi:glucose-6-phosphate dehydrogenase [Micrococcus flavus]|uniref:Glucose-6-phosphate 1-dehydrogenase n=1 Tax=Micrococcus flavus TaxID=384602 RepID=A0A4Y8X3G7_9MICC|nr:glucose-6-phosphate dehydrogenase [Micrococcus flavus]MBB4882075.1 glucose-6-phosphate 1-dehydrogenase [Micrococcus flavus]TFI03987.1 glucose-6-phosphate dehydrogenase [Micrococcus flavus]GGK50113.1 glucose-6-phosphate 1-dehydrogenase [Micrococcus flavus]